MIDVIVDDLNTLQSSTSRPQPTALSSNPHATRVSVDHCYVAQCSYLPPSAQWPRQVAKPQRMVPEWLSAKEDGHHPSNEMVHASPDGVFNYASAVLNDGLFMLEF